jgi:DNA-binding NtrC family response regulator
MLNAYPVHAPRGISVLSVSPLEEDHRSLKCIFALTDWKLYRAKEIQPVSELLGSHPISVILCDNDLPKGSWKDLLEDLSHSTLSPPVIVTSRVADYELWGEILYLGGHDVLAKPFDPREVIQVVSQAWRKLESGRPRASFSEPVQRASAMA